MSGDTGIRVGKRRGYTVVYNDLLPGDAALSARAWGLYVYLVGRPEGWEARASHLQSVFKEGRDAIYKALGELVEQGLMEREQYTEPGSHLRRTRFVIPDDVETRPRRSAPETDSQEPGTQEPGTPEPEKPGQVTTDSTTPDAPSTDGASSDSLRSSGAIELTEAERETGRDESGALLVGKRREALVQEVTKAWWEWAQAKNALPAQSFIACRGVVNTALANGVPPKRVKSALARLTDEARPISGGSLQIALGGASTRAPQHPQVDAEHRGRVDGLF